MAIRKLSRKRPELGRNIFRKCKAALTKYGHLAPDEYEPIFWRTKMLKKVPWKLGGRQGHITVFRRACKIMFPHSSIGRRVQGGLLDCAMDHGHSQRPRTGWVILAKREDEYADLLVLD